MIKVDHITKKFQIKKRKQQNKLFLKLKNLFVNEYEELTAVNDVSFSIEKGEIVGYLGPNGAGKSTTIKMLVGILYPSDGEIVINNLNPFHDRERYTIDIGVLFGQRSQLYWDIPIIETFRLNKKIYNISDHLFHQQLELFIEILGIKDFLNTPTRQLSLGQRIRAELCATFLHNPSIIYLDEPTIGLDVVAKGNIRNFLKKINELYQTTIILTTHDVLDIESLCQRIILIDHGMKMYDGDLQKLLNNYMMDKEMAIELKSDQFDVFLLNQLNIKENHLIGRQLRILFNQNEIRPLEIINKIMQKYEIIDFKILEPNIENVIRKIYLGVKSG